MSPVPARAGMTVCDVTDSWASWPLDIAGPLAWRAGKLVLDVGDGLVLELDQGTAGRPASALAS
jgi:hypothetical protein